LHHDHHSIFAALSVVVAIFGSWTALDLFQRVRSHEGRERLAWLALAALVMGTSIWSMHFIAMLGFDPGSPVSYNPGLTALSFFLAVGGTAGAFFAATWRGGRWPTVIAAGVAMGLSICLMHYVGMAALETAASLGYRPPLVGLSLLIAVVAATAALFAARQERALSWRLIAAVVLGLAIVGMHYTAMTALVLTPTAGAADVLPGAPPLVLAVAVAAGTVTILFLALGASLWDQRQNLLSVLEAGGVGYWEVRLPSGAMAASRRMRELFDIGPDEPLTQRDLVDRLTEDSRAEREAMMARVLRGEGEYAAEYQVKANGRWVRINGQLARDRSGEAKKLWGVVLDVTDRHEAFTAVAQSELRQRLLINELNHRVKNTLATIQAIATLTARRAEDLPSFKAAFEARLMALSKTHNVLTAHGWERAELRPLLEGELSPYATEQVRLEGPEVWLNAEGALALGMTFHELATNAAKYGALSTADGCVHVRWEEGADGVRILWSERGGPAASAPAKTGFGSRLVKTTVEGTLRGQARFDYLPGGLQVELRFPANSERLA